MKNQPNNMTSNVNQQNSNYGQSQGNFNTYCYDKCKYLI